MKLSMLHDATRPRAWTRQASVSWTSLSGVCVQLFGGAGPEYEARRGGLGVALWSGVSYSGKVNPKGSVGEL